MTDIAITEKDGWLHDARGNRNSIAYHGSREAAEKALRSLVDCDNCVNCSDCSGCSYCSDCSYCSGCSGCSYCSYCSYCSGCSDCSYCSGCSGCSDCSDCLGSNGDKNAETVVIPAIKNIHQAVYSAASQPGALDMSSWHCGTTHCRAGWAVTLAGDAGKALEGRFSTELAAMLIYRESGSPISPCRFYDDAAAALADMKRLAEQEAGE